MKENKIITEKGLIIYTDTKADLSDKERRLLDLTLGAKPMNEEEERMAREIRSIRDSGGIVEIPFD